MKHKIRQRVLDPVTGLKVTKIENVNGELGSGIVDKNGKEIFEGDRVKIDDGDTYTIHFAGGGAFIAFNDNRDTCTYLFKRVVEVIGHVDD